MATAYLGLGSNLGDREGHLRRAIERLSRQARVEAMSSVYETDPVGYRDQPMFLNMVCRVSTTLTPHDLLRFTRGIEAGLGRKPGFPNAPREIDIDVLLYDDETITTPDLVVPHPRMLERAFVLVPLAEFAPELVVPGTNRTVSDLVAGISPAGVSKYGSLEKSEADVGSPDG